MTHHPLEITGNFDRLLIDGVVKPSWADIVSVKEEGSRDNFHLITREKKRRKLIWCDPGEYPVRDRKDQRVAVFMIEKGFFAVLDEVERIRNQGFRQPKWAKRIGVDQYGLYADLVFKGMTQRFRWIAPGDFMMGASDDEEQWVYDGPQHLVVLTESYWLADTACTQSFYQAVTGENRSKFQGPERPVERVSRVDAQEFLGQLNEKVSGLELELPTEAQWEYACRAGTTTPFFWGDNITTDQVNFDGTKPYNGGAIGEYRAKTIEVKSLPCNGWGLYQMHGNVREWCRDWFGEYSAEPEIDPLGPVTSRHRMCRGGCWSNNGKLCRSASRRWPETEYRHFRIGFRLSCRRSRRR